MCQGLPPVELGPGTVPHPTRPPGLDELWVPPWGPSLVWPPRVGPQDCHPRTKVVRAAGDRGAFGHRPVLSLGALCSPFNQRCTRDAGGSVSGAG